MAYQTTKLYVREYGFVDSHQPTTVIDISSAEYASLGQCEKNMIDPSYGELLYFKFDGMPQNLSQNVLYYAKACFAMRPNNRWGDIVNLRAARASFDTQYLTWNNRPNLLYVGSIYIHDESRTDTAFLDQILQPMSSTESATDLSEFTRLLLNSPAAALVTYNANNNSSLEDIKLRTLANNVSLPYIEITYDDSLTIPGKINAGTFAAYVDPRVNATINWHYDWGSSSGYKCAAASPSQQSASVFWREQGATTWNEVHVSEGTMSVTIPANTFPTASSVEIYLEGTDAGGNTSQTAVQTFSTSAPLVTSTPVSPINTIEDGSMPIMLRWTFSSTDGRDPSRYFLYWRQQGETTWNTLYNPGAGVIDTSYEVPADTFPAGTIEWGVQAANVDGVGGPVGSTTFICRAAPYLGGLSSDGKPFLTVSWQADGQMAYEITVDGHVYGPYFGEDKNFTLPDYLKDGTHVIRVRIMGAWNLWSKTESLQVTIANEAGESITLNGYSGPGNELSWETQEQTSDFLIYRNGKAIGHTAQITFTDRFAPGESTYQVVNRLTDGNYSISNEIEISYEDDNVYITELGGGQWLEIELSMRDQMDPEYEDSVESVYEHLAGDAFPSVILSGYQESRMSFTALFLKEQEEDHQKFRRLFGKPVIMKLRDGSTFVGVLDKRKRTIRKNFWTAYSFTLRQIAWEDYVDDTQ